MPEVLVSGDHAKIARWREVESRKKTEQQRTESQASRESVSRVTDPRLNVSNEPVRNTAGREGTP